MDSEKVLHLGYEAKIRLPNVDETIDKGHALHASDDPSLRDTEAQALARQIIAEFKALKPTNETETAYLSSARSIVLGYGRALSRRKEQWKNSLEAAEAEHARAFERLRESSNERMWLLAFLWKIAPYAILMMSGIIVAQTSNQLPEDATRVLVWIISAAVGLVFVVAGRLAALWFRDVRRNAIDVRCDAQLFQAHIVYEEGKKKEQQYYRARMCEAWKQYTGEDFPKTASYEMVMAGDIETRKEIERGRLNHNTSTLWLMRRFARLLRGRRKGEPEPAPAPSYGSHQLREL